MTLELITFGDLWTKNFVEKRSKVNEIGHKGIVYCKNEVRC